MKTLIFNILKIAAIALIIGTTACNKPDEPKGAKLYLPKQAVLSSETSDCATTSITLQVAAEGATEYVWRVNGEESSNRTEILTVEKSDMYFPDEKVISVAGKNASGTGMFKDITISFAPCAMPTKAEIKGKTNFCPTPFAWLTAKCEYATSYKWFKNGVEIPDQTAILLRANEDAAYTVIGVNEFGESVLESDPVLVSLNNCDEAFYLWGAWNVTGIGWWGTSAGVPRNFGTQILPVNDTLFKTRGWNTLPSMWSVYFMRDEDGDYYMPMSYLCGVSGGEDGRQRIRVTVGSTNVIVTEGRIYFDISEDNTLFRFPQEIPTENGIGINPCFTIYALPGGSEFNAATTRAFTNADISNPLFRVPGTIGSFNEAPARKLANAPQNVRWIKSKKQSVVKTIPANN